MFDSRTIDRDFERGVMFVNRDFALCAYRKKNKTKSHDCSLLRLWHSSTGKLVHYTRENFAVRCSNSYTNSLNIFHRNQKHVRMAVANKVWKQVWT